MDFQTALNIALQTHAPGLGLIMMFFSLLGQVELYLLIIPLILWCYDKKLGLRIIFLLTICTVINAMFKILFHTPRPYWISSEVKALTSDSSFGMPSGHAQTSVTFLGYISAWFNKTYIWVICITLIILVAISRIYLGVHFFTDIIAGWIFALIILLVFLQYENSVTEWFSRKKIIIRFFLALCASIIMIILTQLMIFSLGTWHVPAEWSALAFAQTNQYINPISLRDSLMAAGLLFGAATGASISADYLPYVVDGSNSQKVIRYLTGIIILGLLWVLLSASTKSLDLTGYGMTYFRAALAGIWVTVGAPYLFCRFGLSNKG
jgi:membrane-associated phospholipid phosphatase